MTIYAFRITIAFTGPLTIAAITLVNWLHANGCRPSGDHHLFAATFVLPWLIAGIVSLVALREPCEPGHRSATVSGTGADALLVHDPIFDTAWAATRKRQHLNPAKVRFAFIVSLPPAGDPASGAPMAAATERITMTMRELDRLKLIQDVMDGRLKPWRAAQRLELTTRQIRRLVARLREHGPAGLVSRKRSRPGNTGWMRGRPIERFLSSVSATRILGPRWRARSCGNASRRRCGCAASTRLPKPMPGHPPSWRRITRALQSRRKAISMPTGRCAPVRIWTC